MRHLYPPLSRVRCDDCGVDKRIAFSCERRTDCPHLQRITADCPHCGGTMRIIAFTTFGADMYKILKHIGVDSEAPRITSEHG